MPASRLPWAYLGIALGAMLGIAAFRHPHVERAITPVLDLMQTVPVFAYLVPILWFFGFNPVAAMIATIVSMVTMITAERAMEISLGR